MPTISSLGEFILMAISGATTVTSSPVTMTYWDTSGNYYTVLGGTYKYLTNISSSKTSVPTTGWASATCAGNTTVSTSKFTSSLSLPVVGGTYTAAYYVNSNGSQADMLVWWNSNVPSGPVLVDITFVSYFSTSTLSSSALSHFSYMTAYSGLSNQNIVKLTENIGYTSYTYTYKYSISVTDSSIILNTYIKPISCYPDISLGYVFSHGILIPSISYSDNLSRTTQIYSFKYDISKGGPAYINLPYKVTATHYVFMTTKALSSAEYSSYVLCVSSYKPTTNTFLPKPNIMQYYAKNGDYYYFHATKILDNNWKELIIPPLNTYVSAFTFSSTTTSPAFRLYVTTG